MKYIKIECLTGYIGTESTYYVAVPEEWNEKEINGYAGDLSDEHAIEWEGLATSDICPEDYSSEEEYKESLESAICNYWENDVGFYWEYVSKEEWEDNKGDII